jgi:CubicO group peptidase (beta-lactamase class C family)
LDSTEYSRLKDLQQQIETVVGEYKGLCAGLTLIRKDQPDWIVGLGNRDKSEHTPVSVNTIFRTASLSKLFVSLAILQLQEQGQLKLEDPIKDLVPEVAFENPWEDTHPVRILHLLEHTTGWDEIHLVERMHHQFPPIALKKALQFHPHSRKSRWIPGSRKAYSNSGYAVAAYIVEKLSGLAFEKYVEEAILKPLNMRHTTFFNDSLYKQWGAQTYNWAMEKVAYTQELYRPCAALNSSPKDLTQVLKLLMHRGQIDSLKLLDKKSIERMELPQSTPGAKAGLTLGMGLGNYTTVYKGFTYHGHDGAMDGGLAQLAYLPEHGIGHILLLNANNAQAMQRIVTLLRDFEIERLPVPEAQETKYKGQLEVKAGYYLAINPRNHNLFYQDVLFAGIERIEVHANTVFRSWILPGQGSIYHPVSANQCSLGATKEIGLVVAEDPLAGEVLYTENAVLKPISHFRVFAQLTLLGLWLSMMIGGLFSFIILVMLSVINRKKYEKLMHISVLPTLASILILLTFLLRYYGLDNADRLFSEPSLLAMSLLSCSILFVVGAVASVMVMYKSRRNNLPKLVYYPLIILSCLHVLAAMYLGYFGFIPLITWA